MRMIQEQQDQLDREHMLKWKREGMMAVVKWIRENAFEANTYYHSFLKRTHCFSTEDWQAFLKDHGLDKGVQLGYDYRRFSVEGWRAFWGIGGPKGKESKV